MKIRDFLELTPAKRVFMDCDGVIYDTNKLKTDAFAHALHPYPQDKVDALLTWHQQSGGISRYVKLQRFFEEIHPVADPEAAFEDALMAYAAYAAAGYDRLDPRPEAIRFASHFGPDRTYVVSGGDQRELEHAFRRADIAHHFRAICGSPTTKIQHLERIFADTGDDPRACLFIGDGLADYHASLHFQIPFIFLTEMTEWTDGPELVRNTPRNIIVPTWSALIDALTT